MNKECCVKCWEVMSRHCFLTICLCHTSKGEKPKEKCGYGCGREWNEQGDFSNCPSAYHMVPDLERPSHQARHEMGQSVKQAINRANDRAASTASGIDLEAPTQPESSWEERFDEIRTMDDGDVWIDRKRVKTFIRHEIEQARGKAYMDGFDDAEVPAQNKGRLDVLAELEGKLPPERNITHPQPCSCVGCIAATSMDTYRTTVLKLIKSIKGE